MESTRRRTRGEAAIESLLAKLDPSSERYRVLLATREFKASWVELGERLTEVREGGEFRTWGHETFEAYCRTELRLKPDTANKLTRSYVFLKEHEPVVLREEGSVTRTLLLDEVARRALSLGNVMEIESREAAREAVASGLGVGIISSAEIVPDPRLHSLRFSDWDARMSEWLVCLATRVDRKIMRAVLGLLRR